MRRGSKPAKSKEAKRPVTAKSPKDEDYRVRDLEKRLAEALRDKAEAQEQQAATAEILRVISTSPTDLQPVFETIAENAVRLCDAAVSGVLRFDGSLIHLAAYRNFSAAVRAIVPQDYPMAPTRRRMSGRAILDCTVVHVADVLSDPDYPQEVARSTGWRSFLSVPMLLEAQAIGAVTVVRTRSGPFSDRQIELLKTFADQAVIAIENVRLFNETKEALDRQTATSEILGVISSSPTEVEPVLDAIARRSVELCDAYFANVFLVEGEMVRWRASHNVPPEANAVMQSTYPLPTHADEVIPRIIRERRMLVLEDGQRAGGTAHAIERARAIGHRSWVGMPLVREGSAIGVLAVSRREVKPFSDKQIALLQTFADQAVIAIENVRLFNETKEALERQTATSEILRVIAGSPTEIQPVLDAIAENAARVCGANDAVIYRIEQGDVTRLVAGYGPIPKRRVGEQGRNLIRESIPGRAMLDRQTVHVHDIQSEEGDEFPFSRELQRQLTNQTRTLLSTPLLREGVSIGAILIRRAEVQPFTDRQIELLQTFADQAVIAIENVRLFTELQAKNRALTEAHAQVSEALEQQTATSEILGVISSSPTDVQPVFDVIAGSARRLCGAAYGQVQLYDGALIHLAALESTGAEGHEAIRAVYPLRVGDRSAGSRAIETRSVVEIPDLTDDSAYPFKSVWEASGLRSLLAVPMLRDGDPMGAIGVGRTEPGPFSQTQIDLLKTFADQAVIAIENVRLFNETKEALEQQTASSEILRVISSSPTDVQPVFDAIAANAVRLCGALWSAVIRFDGELMHLVSLHKLSDPVGMDAVRRAFPRPPSRAGATDRAILTMTTAYVPDVRDDREYQHQGLAQAAGYRSHLSVPMLREGRPVGAITVAGEAPHAFSDRQIALLQTFADQAVIAIENTRLFTELQSSNRDLTTALDQQTATSEILKVISSSPTDVQPVFNAIAENARRLCDADFCNVARYEHGLIHLSAHAHSAPELVDAMRRMFPMPPTRATTFGRTIIEGGLVYIRDIRQDPEYSRTLAEAHRSRCGVGVPMLRDAQPIGAIVVGGREPQKFSDGQLALLQTFADQAVIAIENVRLFTELQEKNRALTTAHAQVTESLEQQTATGEILRVIASSPTDIQPVLDTVAESAAHLCEAYDTSIFRLDGDRLRRDAHHGPIPAGVIGEFTVPLVRGSFAGRSVLDGRVVHLADGQTEANEFPEGSQFARRLGFRAILIVPLLREGVAIGAITLRRSEARLFSERQVALLQTFADQAVIAIENVRLFKELQASNRDLTTALDKQTATSDILRVISQSQTDVQPVFDSIVRNAVRLCGALHGGVYTFDGELVHARANEGYTPEQLEHWRSTFPRSVTSGSVVAKAVRSNSVVLIDDLETAPAFEVSRETLANLRVRGSRSLLAVPMTRHDEVIGAIGLAHRRVGAFSEAHVELLKTFADQAVIAIENVRLFTELQEKNKALTHAHAQVSEALDRQTATSEILSVISSSPTDVQPVFDAVAENAARLCGADDAVIQRVEDAVLKLVAHFGAMPAPPEDDPMPITRDMAVGCAVLDRRTMHVHDMAEEHRRGNYPASRSLRGRLGYRTLLCVPLIRQDVAVGVIVMRRGEVQPFTDQQIALVQTFADQAVIAIENVRLFKELEARTQDLTRSVGELRALGEVGQAISSTLDLPTVLTTIVGRATQLAGMDAGVIYEYDEAREVFEPRATERLEEDIVRALVATPIRKGEGATGQLAEVREPIQVADVRDRAQAFQAREVLVRAGYRAALAVPLMREDRLLGGLTVFRKTPGEFAPEAIDLLRTFATQSALAIQNARLFREIEDKSRQLEVASQHKSEFLANMSHELRTPLNAIIGFSEVLSERMFGELNEKQEEYLKDIYASGTHLLSLINDILDLSKIEAGRMELELSDFHLPTALDSALTLVRERAGRRGIALQMNVDNRLGQIQADERKVRQVVLNLLSNAIKFTPEGGRIEVGAVLKDGLVEVSVSDTGVGIAPEDQEAVFEEFRQVGTADKKVEGTGLGLTLCRKFVELHGGKIWVKSELGVGSTFTFSLPGNHSLGPSVHTYSTQTS